MIAGDTELLDLVLKRRPLETQAQRRTVRPGKHSACFTEDLDNVFSFRSFQGCGRAERTTIRPGLIDFSQGNL